LSNTNFGEVTSVGGGRRAQVGAKLNW
jgi:hypothetical protein